MFCLVSETFHAYKAEENKNLIIVFDNVILNQKDKVYQGFQITRAFIEALPTAFHFAKILIKPHFFKKTIEI